MQRATRTNERTHRRAAQLTKRQPRRHRNACTAVFSPTPNVLTLAPATPLSLPSLAGVRQSYSFSEDDKALLTIAQRLIRKGYCTEQMWNGVLLDFVSKGFDAMLVAHRGDDTIGAINVHAGITRPDYRWWDTNKPLSPSELLVAVEVSECGWFQTASTVTALERQCRGAGVAFYIALSLSLDRFCETFDYHRAKWDYDQSMEMAQDELSAECESPAELAERLAQHEAELNDPNRNLPKCLVAPLTRGTNKGPRVTLADAIATLERFRLGLRPSRLTRKIDTVLTLAREAIGFDRQKHGEERYGDILPSFIVAFKPNDNIYAAFDEYGQHALEGDLSPSYTQRFDTENPRQIDRALDTIAKITRMYAAACRLHKLMHGAQKSDE
jgi:hypothetical protein